MPIELPRIRPTTSPVGESSAPASATTPEPGRPTEDAASGRPKDYFEESAGSSGPSSERLSALTAKAGAADVHPVSTRVPARKPAAHGLFDARGEKGLLALLTPIVAALDELAPDVAMQRPAHPARLRRRDRHTLLKLRALLDKAALLTPDERARLGATLKGDWLPSGLSAEQLRLRLEVAVHTGYLLVDKGAQQAHPTDEKGWSPEELERISDVLLRLPPSLCRLSSLRYIVRDERAEWDDHAIAEAAKKVERADLPERLRLLPASLIVGVMRMARVGGTFGIANYAGHEVRLFNELLHGSRLPLLGNMLAFTTVHEIGHHLFKSDAAIARAFSELYARAGRDEQPYRYTRGSVDEAFGVGIGMFAIAPEKLKEVAPETFRFFQQRFGAEFSAFQGSALDGSVIDLVYRLG